MKNSYKLWLGLASCAALGLFGAFTLLVKLDRFTQIDFNLTVKIQDKVPAALNDVLHLFSAAGHVGSMSLILLVGLLVLLKTRWGALPAMFLFYAGQGTEFFLKEMLHHPGPPFQFHRVGSGVFFDKDYVVPGSSYPSGHSFRAVFVAIIISYLLVRRYGWSMQTIVAIGTLGTIAVCIMAAKVVLGEHWTTDIVGGALFAPATAFFTLLIVR